jgi:uncharacterized SAM-binding protein YcdF (DUF218 family)
VVRRRSFVLRLLFAIAVLVLAGFLTRSWWLPAAGYALIHDDGPAKADIAVVLGGDFYGHRIERAAQLVREGYVPAVLVSGPPGFYGRHECDFAIPYIVSRGYPAEWFIPLPHEALSTKEEAAVVLAALRRRGVHSFLLVTSDFHTGRSARIFRTAEPANGGGPSMRVVAAPDEHFRAGSWWLTRESQKVVFFEWCKTFATAAGM